ncbi:MAG: DUF4394 domain-containing protein [bacterium]|jgi:hypothetical protein|nr:DUF4394 domain-containing protein [Betaproteobacteria bacterium]
MVSVVRCALHAALLCALLSGCAGLPIEGGARETVFAATQSNRLLRLDPASPSRVASERQIVGMHQGEQIAGLDFRPADGRLYALGTAGQLYRIDPATAVATRVGPGGMSALVLDDIGFALDPGTDRIRLVTTGGYNLRLDPDTGVAVDGDPAAAGVQSDRTLGYAEGEFEQGRVPRLAAAAIVYTPGSGRRPASTTQYAIDRDTRTLVTQGSPRRASEAAPPESGDVYAVGALTIDLGSGPLSLGAVGTRLALLCVARGSRSELYRLDLGTAAIEPLGVIALGEPVIAIAVVPAQGRALEPAATGRP